MNENQKTGSINGKDATLRNLSVAVELADQIRSTYGPRGRDKLIVHDDGEITISNDGATILKLLVLKHPIAQLLTKLSVTQDVQIGDGTTGVVLFASYLCEQAHKLVNLGYHTHVIIRGYKLAYQFVSEYIVKLQKPIVSQLQNIIRVPLNSKILNHEQIFFSELLMKGMEMVTSVGNEFDLNSIRILTIPGASLLDSYIIDGIVFKQTFSYAGYEQQSKCIESPKILLLNHEIELKHQKEYAHLMINNVSEYENFVNTEWDLVYRKMDQIYKTECNLILDTQGIGDLATQHFTRMGITNISRIDSATMREISESIGAPVHASLENLSNDQTLHGTCNRFEELTIGDDQYCVLSGSPKKKTVTLILRGSSDEILQEAKRSIHDAICVLSNALKYPWYLYGGGATETTLRSALHKHCDEMEQLPPVESPNKIIALNAKHLNTQVIECMRVYGDALQELVATLARNANLDSADIIAQLNYIHYQNTPNANRCGININTGMIDDMEDLCVFEPSTIKKHALSAATEAACMILSIDHVVTMPRAETEQERVARLAMQRKQEQERIQQHKRQILQRQHESRI
jgi:T-complex protein 1 subunit eta